MKKSKLSYTVHFHNRRSAEVRQNALTADTVTCWGMCNYILKRGTEFIGQYQVQKCCATPLIWTVNGQRVCLKSRVFIISLPDPSSRCRPRKSLFTTESLSRWHTYRQLAKNGRERARVPAAVTEGHDIVVLPVHWLNRDKSSAVNYVFISSNT